MTAYLMTGEEQHMREKLLLVGAGGLGRIVSEHAAKDYKCFFLDDGVENGTKVCSVEVIGNIGDIEKLRNEYSLLIVCIGNNRLREKIYARAKELGYEFPNIIADSAYISPYASVGRGCVILNNAVVQNGAVVGDGVILNAGVEAHQDCRIGECSLIYANSVIRSYAKIGRRVKVESTVTVGNNVVIEDDRVVETSILRQL